MVSISSSHSAIFNDLNFEVLEYVKDINNVKTNKPLVAKLEYSTIEKLNIDLEQIKEKGIYNVIFSDISKEDLKQVINYTQKKHKGISISITNSNHFKEIDDVIEVIRECENKVCYVLDTSKVEDPLKVFKRIKKHITFILVKDYDNYSYPTLALTTFKTRNLVKYILKHDFETSFIIDSDLLDYNRLRNDYLNKNKIKRLIPRKINKSIRVFNYKIDCNESLSLEELLIVELMYVKAFIDNN